MVALIQNVL